MRLFSHFKPRLKYNWQFHNSCEESEIKIFYKGSRIGVSISALEMFESPFIQYCMPLPGFSPRFKVKIPRNKVTKFPPDKM